MQPLATTRRMMTWLSMCTADGLSNASRKMACVAFTLAISILNVMGLIASLVFSVKFFFIYFDGAVLAMMSIFGVIGAIYFLISAILMRQQIDNIFTSLSVIYNTRECDKFEHK